ncbi:MAG: hypothetical protein H8E66_08760 [Planctomycetes bacterium]|nr:hypothetical protein [Planctomycetota bacterium]
MLLSSQLQFLAIDELPQDNTKPIIVLVCLRDDLLKKLLIGEFTLAMQSIGNRRFHHGFDHLMAREVLTDLFVHRKPLPDGKAGIFKAQCIASHGNQLRFDRRRTQNTMYEPGARLKDLSSVTA